MASPKNEVEQLLAVLEAISDSAEVASEEELDAELRADGHNPDNVVAEIQRMVGATAKLQRQGPLREAKAALERMRQNLGRAGANLIPSSASARRALFEKLMVTRAELPHELTIAFREGTELSDEDIASTLEDLAELGLLSGDADSL